MGIVNFNLPRVDSADTKKAIKQIYSYLYSLTEQLNHTLSSLDGDNMTADYAAEIDQSASVSDLAAKVEAISTKVANAGNSVKKNAVVAAINESTESVGISGSKLAADPYAEGTLYILGMTADGQLKLCSLNILDNGTASSTLTVGINPPPAES